MKSTIVTCLCLLSISFITPDAFAKSCAQALKEASKKAAMDKDCQKDAKNLFSAFRRQVKTCKKHRRALRKCRKAKRGQKKECRQDKRDAKKACRKLKGKAKRTCKKKARKAKRACAKSARKQKRACRSEARDTAAFKICKDKRKLTAKSAGNAAKCAGKYYLPAAGVCAAEIAASK